MTLREFVREQTQRIYEALRQGQAPPTGEYDTATLKECMRRATVQIGTTHYRPDSVLLEFIFTEPSLGPAILTVRVPAPEPIVYMPVPDWVIEDVWQGEVTGTFRFASEAQVLLKKLHNQIFSETNILYFEERPQLKHRNQ
ncbi:hypothetical protein HRbin15_02014 [bacterium HR15]|nr:hypothetical protein HRbin15_02014 [bacterium HR15]